MEEKISLEADMVAYRARWAPSPMRRLHNETYVILETMHKTDLSIIYAWRWHLKTCGRRRDKT